MLKNKFIIKNITVDKNKINYEYEGEGDEQFKKFFWMGKLFLVEYNEDLQGIPESILVIPLVSNVLPIAWLNNAEIVIPELDFNFYKCLKKIKRGYKKMLPNIKFKRNIKVYEKKKNL